MQSGISPMRVYSRILGVFGDTFPSVMNWLGCDDIVNFSEGLEITFQRAVTVRMSPLKQLFFY